MTDHSSPDYELDEHQAVDSMAGLKALAHPTRNSILDMLLERAASITQLAAALGRPKGSVGHHVGVLEDAGMVRVVRTRRVRAITEKFYGRTARWFLIAPPDGSGVDPTWAVSQALSVADRSATDQLMMTARYARIPAARASEFADQLVDLVDRFLDTERAGDTVYAMIAGVFATTQPYLADAESSDG